MFHVLLAESVRRTGGVGNVADGGAVFPQLGASHLNKAASLLHRQVQSEEVKGNLADGWHLGER